MIRMKLVLGLLGALLSLGTEGCQGPCEVASTTGTTGVTGTTTIDLGVCDQATFDADMDSGSASMTLARLQIDAYGYDLDGIDNFGRPTVAGCNHGDADTGGVDSSLYLVGSVVDLNAGVEEMIANGSAVVEIRATKLAADANDPCLGITATLTRAADPSHPITMNGYGQMTNHVIQAVLGGALDLSIPVRKGLIAPSWCNGGVCNDAVLDMSVRSPRVTITLDATHTKINRGFLGGFVFYADVDPAYTAANAMGLQAAFSALASTANLDTAALAFLLGESDAALDLHMNVDGTISPCIGTSDAVNGNSISAGFMFSSE